MLAAYKAAILALLAGNAEYTVEGVGTFKKANLPDIQRGLEYWASEVEQLSDSSNGGVRVRGITPCL